MAVGSTGFGHSHPSVLRGTFNVSQMLKEKGRADVFMFCLGCFSETSWNYARCCLFNSSKNQLDETNDPSNLAIWIL